MKQKERGDARDCIISLSSTPDDDVVDGYYFLSTVVSFLLLKNTIHAIFHQNMLIYCISFIFLPYNI